MVRPELTIHVQEVLTHADNVDKRIPVIKEPEDERVKVNNPDAVKVSTEVRTNGPA